jgi:hypothetical protein
MRPNTAMTPSAITVNKMNGFELASLLSFPFGASALRAEEGSLTDWSLGSI